MASTFATDSGEERLTAKEVEARVALPDDLSDAERRFLRSTLDRARSLDAWTRGLYAECLIAELLPGAELADSSISGWDVMWKGVTLAVRTTGAQCTTETPSDGRPTHRDYAGSWLFKPRYVWEPDLVDFTVERRRVWAEVAVLAFHAGVVLAEGWSFFVLPAAVVEHWPAQTLRPSTVARICQPVSPDGLADAVRCAHADQQNRVRDQQVGQDLDGLPEDLVERAREFLCRAGIDLSA